MSQNDNLVLHLAPMIRSELAQKALLEVNHPGLLYKMASNKEMTKETWWKLAKIKNQVNLTTKLVIDGPRNLDDAQADYLLKDRRAAVRVEVLACSLAHISYEFGMELIESGRITENDASRWLLSQNPPRILIKPLAKISRSLRAIEVLKYSDIYTPEEAVDVLLERTAPGLNKTLLAGLIDRRKELIPLLLKLDDSPYLLAAISQSRHIFKDDEFHSLIERIKQSQLTSELRNYPAGSEWVGTLRSAAINIARHPNASPTILTAAEQLIRSLPTVAPRADGFFTDLRADRVSKQITVNWKRLTVADRQAALNSLKTSLANYPTLAKSPNSPDLPKSTTGGRYVDLRRLSTENDKRNVNRFNAIRLLSQEQLEADISPKLDAAGLSAWQTFFELSLNWYDSVADLLQTTLSLAKSA